MADISKIKIINEDSSSEYNVKDEYMRHILDILQGKVPNDESENNSENK